MSQKVLLRMREEATRGGQGQGQRTDKGALLCVTAFFREMAGACFQRSCGWRKGFKWSGQTVSKTGDRPGQTRRRNSG